MALNVKLELSNPYDSKDLFILNKINALLKAKDEASSLADLVKMVESNNGSISLNCSNEQENSSYNNGKNNNVNESQTLCEYISAHPGYSLDELYSATFPGRQNISTITQLNELINSLVRGGRIKYVYSVSKGDVVYMDINMNVNVVGANDVFRKFINCGFSSKRDSIRKFCEMCFGNSYLDFIPEDIYSHLKDNYAYCYRCG